MARHFGPKPEYGIRHFHEHMHPLCNFPALTHVQEAVCTSVHAIPPHIHPTFEICHIFAGTGEWFAEGRTFPLKAGDLYITKPGEVHGGRTNAREPYHIFALGIDPAALPFRWDGAARKQLPGEGGEDDVARAVDDARASGEGLGALEQRVIPGAFGAEQYYRRLLAELDREPAEPGLASLRTMMVQAVLVEFLVFVARCYATHRLGQDGEGFPALRAGGPFEELKRWLAAPERLAHPPTLAEMAARTSLSPSHFAVLFKRETAQTPLEFLTAARVEAAAQRLRAEPEIKITTLAHELGFSSSQYFSLVFKKIKGCTPGEWREQR